MAGICEKDDDYEEDVFVKNIDFMVGQNGSEIAKRLKEKYKEKLLLVCWQRCLGEVSEEDIAVLKRLKIID